MTLQIELTPEEEARLEAMAREQGLDPAEWVRRWITGHLLLPSEDPTDALFATWDAEDATDDPEELARRIRDWEELKAAMNATRAAAGERLLFR